MSILTVQRFVRLRAMIGANDLFIAAHARSLALALVTNNTAELGRVKWLRAENWTLPVRRSRSKDESPVLTTRSRAMPRNRIKPDQCSDVRFIARQRDLIVERTFIDGELDERLRAAPAMGSRLVVQLTLDDMVVSPACVRSQSLRRATRAARARSGR